MQWYCCCSENKEIRFDRQLFLLADGVYLSFNVHESIEKSRGFILGWILKNWMKGFDF